MSYRKKARALVWFVVCLGLSISLPGCDVDDNNGQENADRPPVRVGILTGIGAPPLWFVLDAPEDMEAFFVHRLTAELAEECDVLIVTQQTDASPLIAAQRHLHDFVQGGGGALFLHDAVGYRVHMPMFPSVGSGSYHPKLDTVKIAKEHPVTKGIDEGHVFSPGFRYDHVIIEPGPDGIVVVENENDDPVVVVGGAGDGRVILNGMLPGIRGGRQDPSGAEREPEGEERELLINSIYWLAGR